MAKSVLPFIKGERILDVSFGPDYLFRKLPSDKKIFESDYYAEKNVSRDIGPGLLLGLICV